MGETGRTTGAPVALVEEDPNATVACSSPPCFMHELDPTYLGYLGREEVSTLLGSLLAAEWGGIVPDEPRLRTALRRHLGAEGDRPARASGASRGAAASSGAACPGEPLGGGPDHLARTIREALPRIHDDGLRRDLGEVLGALERGGPPRARLPGGG